MIAYIPHPITRCTGDRRVNKRGLANITSIIGKQAKRVKPSIMLSEPKRHHCRR